MPTELTLSPNTLGGNAKIEAGSFVTVAASDVVQTKLTRVKRVFVIAENDPVAGVSGFTAVPSGLNDGKFTLKGWKATGAGDTTPLAATTFGKTVGYLAFGW